VLLFCVLQGLSILEMRGVAWVIYLGSLEELWR
jgi:hypothetical protein